MSHRQFTIDSVPVWTDGSTTEIYHPLSPVQETVDIETVRLALEMSQTTSTSNVTMTAAYDLSDDGCDWGTPVLIQDGNNLPALSTNGVSQSTQFVDIATGTGGINEQRYVRFGVLIKNNSAGNVILCRASLQVDVRC